jgi:hypothetical protein
MLPCELVGVWSGGASGFWGMPDDFIPRGRWNLRRAGELCAKPLELSRDDHKSNFSLGVDEIESARLVEAGFWSNLSHINRVGVLRLRLIGGKELKLAVCTGYDVRTAFTELPGVLGAKLSAELTLAPRDPDFEYGGMTVLTFSQSHGNQFEFLDLDGRCYLLYPGRNNDILPGRWRTDEDYIYFRYGWNTYNPVTAVRGGGWEPTPIRRWAADIVDAYAGDVCGLATGIIPCRLSRHPALRTIHKAIHGRA